MRVILPVTAMLCLSNVAVSQTIEPSAAVATDRSAAETNSANKKPLDLDGEVGLIFTTGNTSTSSLTLALSGAQDFESWDTTYIAESLYKQDEVNEEEGSETTAQKLFVSAQANYKLTDPNNRLFVFAAYEDDRFSGFDYQATAAVGWNQKLWETEDSFFNYSVGPGYTFAETTAGEDRDGFIVRASVDYGKSISETARFTQTFSTQVGIENTKTRSVSAVSAKLIDNLSLKLSLQLDHNSKVDPGIDKLDTKTVVTVVYSFF